MAETDLISMQDIISLCKRRGFIFQGSDIYGGLQGVYDYGPLGAELKNNLKQAWWKAMVYERDDIEGLDAAILTHRLTLEHSGHTDTFADDLVDCRHCKHRMRADHIEGNACESCGSKDLTEPRKFNLMLRTNLGPVDDGTSFGYLRPETAQGIFANFKNVLDATSRKLPFGIAQLGKAFRNEITPRNFVFRVREFEQMELEFFVQPGTDDDWYNYWIAARKQWWIDQGLSEKNLSLQPQTKEELAHYAKATTDILYHFPFGSEELEGIANRTDFDLGSHSKRTDDLKIKAKVKDNTDSTTVLAYTDPQDRTVTVPFVIEPSAGVDRGVLAILAEAYTKEELDGGKSRVVLKLKPHLAPIKVAVIPLAKNNEQLVSMARTLCQRLRALSLGRIRFEDVGNIGKAYRRHDEIGTPLCITVDFDTFEGDTQTVTLRHRDTMEQTRVPVDGLEAIVKTHLGL